MATPYTAGTKVRISVTFTAGATKVDPTDVTLVIRPPDAAQETHAYSEAGVTRSATGVYHRDVLLATAGAWSYRWVASGAVETAAEGTLAVVSLF